MNQNLHHKLLVDFANDLGCNIDDIIDLSSNTNFVKPNISFDFNCLDTNSYENLLQKISTLYNINSNNFTIFNNKNLAISSLFDYFKKDYCTIYSPSNTIYKKISKMYNYEYDNINIFTQMNRAVKENSLIIFTNPNSINGRYYNIDTYLEAWDKLGCTVIIDETYLNFTRYDSVIKYVNKYKNLYILKSFDKFYSYGNIKQTLLISNEVNITLLNEKIEPFNTDILGINFINKLLDDNIFNKTANAINIKNYYLLEQVLKNSSIVEKIYPSDVNFILVQLNIEFSILQKHLKKYKILIKDCSHIDFLDKYHIRISVKTDSDILALKQALKSL